MHSADAAPRLTSAMLVSSLLRSVQNAGGFAAVLLHGDDSAGAILVEWVDRGVAHSMVERATDFDGQDDWRGVQLRSANSGDISADYVAKRRRSDPDMWVIELDIAQPERFIAQFTAIT